jgi:hypothetical protein
LHCVVSVFVLLSHLVCRGILDLRPGIDEGILSRGLVYSLPAVFGWDSGLIDLDSQSFANLLLRLGFLFQRDRGGGAETKMTGGEHIGNPE